MQSKEQGFDATLKPTTVSNHKITGKDGLGITVLGSATADTSALKKNVSSTVKTVVSNNEIRLASKPTTESSATMETSSRLSSKNSKSLLLSVFLNYFTCRPA